jgi:hypothetical protein
MPSPPIRFDTVWRWFLAVHLRELMLSVEPPRTCADSYSTLDLPPPMGQRGEDSVHHPALQRPQPIER